MNVATVVDRTLRAVAAVAAIAFLPLVFFVGIMANDAGTPAGERAGMIILLGGGALSLWVLACSIWASKIASGLPESATLRYLLVGFPPHAFGVLGPGGHPNSPTCGHPKLLHLTGV
jgi:hypothetical protein